LEARGKKLGKVRRGGGQEFYWRKLGSRDGREAEPGGRSKTFQKRRKETFVPGLKGESNIQRDFFLEEKSGGKGSSRASRGAWDNLAASVD